MSSTTLEADPATAIRDRCREIKRQVDDLMKRIVCENRSCTRRETAMLHNLNREVEALRDRYRELQAGASLS